MFNYQTKLERILYNSRKILSNIMGMNKILLTKKKQKHKFEEFSAVSIVVPDHPEHWDMELAWGGNCQKSMFNYVFQHFFLYYCLKCIGVHV